MEIKHHSRIGWNDLPRIETPFFAHSKIERRFPLTTWLIYQIPGLDEALESCRFARPYLSPPENEHQEQEDLLALIEEGEYVLIFDCEGEHPMSSVVRWSTERTPDGFGIPHPNDRVAWRRMPFEGRWVADYRLPMRLRARIERCLEKGRRDPSCHRGLPERLWWGLWAQGRGESDRADDPALDDSIPTDENLARKPPPKPEHNLGEKLVGAGEAALTMVTGVVGVVAGSAAGAGKIVKDVVTGEFVPGEPEAEKLAVETAEKLTYSPRTEAGRDAVRGVASAVEAAKIPPFMPGLGMTGMLGAKPKVTSTGTVGKHVFYDTNQSARPAIRANRSKPTLIEAKVAEKNLKLKPGQRPPPNGNMADAHAEIGVIQQAHDAGVAKGADMVMKVDGRKVCDYCMSDIPAMAEKAGLNSLEITAIDQYGVSHSYIWRPGTKLVKVTP